MIDFPDVTLRYDDNIGRYEPTDYEIGPDENYIPRRGDLLYGPYIQGNIRYATAHHVIRPPYPTWVLKKAQEGEES